VVLFDQGESAAAKASPDNNNNNNNNNNDRLLKVHFLQLTEPNA